MEPPNAHEYSAEGVEAFTRYAIDVINYAYETNDVTPLEQIMTPACQFCTNTVHRLTTIGKAGGRIEGGQLIADFDSASVTGPADGVQTSAGIDLVVTSSTTFGTDDEITDEQAEEQLFAIFNLAREGDVWKLEEVFRADGQLP